MQSTRCVCRFTNYRPPGVCFLPTQTRPRPRTVGGQGQRWIDHLACLGPATTQNSGHSRSLPGRATRTTGSKEQRNKYFLTTPIFYVNAVPHIGHLYTAVVADAVARWHQICGSQVMFSTGTDEHGLKVQQAAQKQGKDPADFCDSISHEFKRLFELVNIGHTDYIRTTEERHLKTVHHFWRTLEDGGHIYKGSYEGWYCMADEAFLTQDDVMELKNDNGAVTKVSAESGQPVEWMKEENYMFRLSEFTPQLKTWLNSGVVQPSRFVPLVKCWLEDGLKDLSVSRQAQRLPWGIPVPGDQTQTIYVWLDALVNYLTVAGYPGPAMAWPPDCHVIGKDILKFHAVYWPAFLMAAGLAPPRKILCHSHWTIDNQKMSKSRGNVVDPYKRLDIFGADGLRYFLLREGVPHSDGNYSDQRVCDCINSELVNTLGNLLGRCTAASVNVRQVAPRLDLDLFRQRASGQDAALLDNLLTLPEKVDEFYRSFHIYKGLEAIVLQLHATNAFVQRQQPWVLMKQPDQTEWLDVVLAVTMETLRITGVLLQPVVPNLARTLLTRLNVDRGHRDWNSVQTFPGADHDRPLGSIDGVLFPRIKLTLPL